MQSARNSRRPRRAGLGLRLARRGLARLRRRYAELAARDPRLSAFELGLPDASTLRFGRGAPVFRVHVRTRSALLALMTLDEARIGLAYLDGDIDLEGELVEALRLRPLLSDRHPLADLWSTLLRPLLFRQVPSDEKWIAEHYDEDPDFFLRFLGPSRCYSQAVFDCESESLERAMERKLDAAIAACRIEPGQRVLDIGGGWGAFAEHAGRRGIRVTSLTISRASEEFLADLIQKLDLPCTVVLRHLLEYECGEKYDAIVNMGVTEHLPDYRATLARYQRLLKPGGRIYLDASAGPRRYNSTSFLHRYIFPGNASTLCLHDYLAEVARTPFELIELHNDRRSYLLTSRCWARNLEGQREEIVRRWGERLYRKFHLFHWGCVYSFGTGQLSAYRWVLELPRERRVKTRLAGGGF